MRGCGLAGSSLLHPRGARGAGLDRGGHALRTRLGPSDVWDEASAHFAEDQLAALVLAIGVINLWNGIAVTTRMVAGSGRQRTR